MAAKPFVSIIRSMIINNDGHGSAGLRQMERRAG